MRAPYVGHLNKTHLLIDWEARDGELFNFIMLVGEREEIVRRGLTSNDTVIERREGLTEVRLGVGSTNSYGETPPTFTWPPFNLMVPAPSNLQLTNSTSTTLDLQWGATECEYYIVTLSGGDTNRTVRVDSEPGTSLYTTTVTVEPYSEYLVEVSPRVGGSIGPSSNPIIARTGALKPDAPVRNLAVNIVSVSEFLVEWEPPVLLEVNGLLRAFEVLAEPFEEHHEELEGNATTAVDRVKRQALQMRAERLGYAARSYLFTDLIPRQEYNVTVRAIATGGSGPASSATVDLK
eukprot:sb/3467589/